MKKHFNLLIVLISAVIFTVLFYRQALGLNLVLYESFVLIWLGGSNQIALKGTSQKVLLGGVIFTAIFTLVHHSTLSFTANFTVFFIFIGMIASPALRSIINWIRMSYYSLVFSFAGLKWMFHNTKIDSKRTRFKVWRKRIFLLPILIIILFTFFYSWANPKFGAVVNRILDWISDGLNAFFEHVNFVVISVFLLGVVVSIFILIRSRNTKIEKEDSEASDTLSRVRLRIKRPIPTLALINEYKSAIFLFASLNILLLGLNSMDISHVWFNFEWDGQYLKQFVHEGTYVLIIAIILSIVLVLYFFRSNLNFYKKNKWLKRLAYLWIAQNVVLSLSVGVRNWHYIQHYSLAYKRIAIVFFLALTLYGLYTVFIKVRRTRSQSYLIRTNFFTWVVVLILSTSVNWDRFIASYNFNNSNKSFVHLNFLSDLSDSALPILNQKKENLEGIQVYQETSFFKSMDISSSNRNKRIYMNTDSYLTKIKWRKKRFLRTWEAKGWLEWNYAEWNAYNELIQ